MNAMHRFFFYFRAFVRCLATSTSPIVLSFDDLHAADSATLELLRTLVADVETSNILFLGCYRDSQVGPDHPLQQEILSLTSAGVNIQTLALSNICEEDLNTLVADTLYLSPFVTRSFLGPSKAKLEATHFSLSNSSARWWMRICFIIPLNYVVGSGTSRRSKPRMLQTLL